MMRVVCQTVLLLGMLLGLLSFADELRADDTEIPEWLQERMSLRVSNQRDNGDMIALVRPLTKAVGDAVVQIVSDGKPVALGLIVAADGYVVTKRSELSGDPIRVRLADGRLQPARVAAVRRKSDLALLRIDGISQPLPVAKLVDQPLPVGSFLISVGRGGAPVGIGVVGSGLRRINHHGKLGVRLDTDHRPATVSFVIAESGADDAGVVAGDRIIAINGRDESDPSAVIRILGDFFPGENVRLTISRNGEKLEKYATIRDLGVLQESENDSKVNGPRSTRLSGFEQVIQHDTVLNPDECGGPVIDTQGRVIGLNIARAGRVVSYALPGSIVIADSASMLTEARGTNGATR